MSQSTSCSDKNSIPVLSIVVPIFDEEESIPVLIESLSRELGKLGKPFEVIAVNDGSRDNSRGVLAAAAADYPWLKVIEFRRNVGQTAALMAGIDHASSDIIVTIDADLQNDPEDIPLLLAKLDEGYDVVSGWRQDRQDAAIRRHSSISPAGVADCAVLGLLISDYPVGNSFS